MYLFYMIYIVVLFKIYLFQIKMVNKNSLNLHGVVEIFEILVAVFLIILPDIYYQCESVCTSNVCHSLDKSMNDLI